MLARVTCTWWQLVGFLVLLLILGTIGELFVPTLPLNIPRKGFGVYGWLALFQSQEFRSEVVHCDVDKLSVEELEEKFCDIDVKFVV